MTKSKDAKIEPPIKIINLAIESINENNIANLKSTVEKMVSSYPNGSTSWLFLAIYENLIGNINSAEKAIKKTLDINPNYGEAHRIYADIFKKRNNYQSSLNHSLKAVEINSNSCAAWDTLGTSYALLHNYLKAKECFYRAIEINPNLAIIYNNLGNTLRHLGEHSESIQSFLKAKELDPNIIEIYNNLALSYFEIKDYDNALNTLNKIDNEKKLQNPQNICDLYTSYGHIFSKLYNYKKAEEYYEKALKIDNYNSSANNGLAEIFCIFMKPEKAINYFERSIKKSPKIQNSISNYILCYNYLMKANERDKFNTTLKFANLKNIKRKKTANKNTDLNKEINIGFVSGDFYNHPVSYFLINPLKNIHDKGFKLFAYSNYNYSDNFTEKLKDEFDEWRDIFHLDEDKIYKTIKNDKIDILFDLSGHTARTSLNVFQLKPAPIQISWLGYSKTTGIKEIDYILCDKISLPKEEENLYVEKPLRMKNSYYCFSKPFDEDIKITEKNNKSFMLGCFNNVKKLNEDVIDLWSLIMKDIPESKITLKFKNFKNKELRQEVKLLFANKGISNDRILILPGSTRREYLLQYNEIDLTLDPFPYPGGTTTCESLYMGVPVITLKGSDFLSRNSENILKNCNLESFVANNKEDYLNKVMKFKKNGSELSKEKVRNKFINSNLFDGKLFADELENKLKKIWEEHCRDE